MGWAVGVDRGRDIGYGVPAVCDHPDCNKKIDRGLAYVCGGEPYGGNAGCGLFFCDEHMWYHDETGIPLCERCYSEKEPFEPKPDVEEWVRFKLTDPSWVRWRTEHEEEVGRRREGTRGYESDS